MERLILKAETLLQEHLQNVKRSKEEKIRLRQARKKVGRCEQAQNIVQLVAEQVQNKAHARISSVVTRCLETIFDDPYEFRIRFDRKRGRTDAILTLLRDGEIFNDPSREVGGGVIDVAAFALRLACLVLSQPKKRKVLILDEPFKFVSEGFRDRIADLIMTLSKEMGVQFIIVSHISELEIGKVIHL